MGQGFTPDLIVHWNGDARDTQFLNAGLLIVTVRATDLAAPALNTISIRDGMDQAKFADVGFFVYIDLPNHDLAYDSHRDRIDIAVDQNNTYSVAELNPATGVVERSLALEAAPEKLAISDDGRYLYVSLSNIVRRVVLDSFVADLDIDINHAVSRDTGDNHIASMLTLPGESSSLVVALRGPGNYENYIGIAVFDGAAHRSQTVSWPDGTAFLIGGPDPTELWGANGGLYQFRISSNGIEPGPAYQIMTDPLTVFKDGLIYSGAGTIIDPSGPSYIQQFDMQGAMLPLPALGKTVMIGTTLGNYSDLLPETAVIFDNGTGQRLQTVKLTGTMPSVAAIATSVDRLLPWGANGVAFRERPSYSWQAASRILIMQLDVGGSGFNEQQGGGRRIRLPGGEVGRGRDRHP